VSEIIGSSGCGVVVQVRVTGPAQVASGRVAVRESIMSTRVVAAVSLCALVFALVPAAVWAQATGQISGRVTDPTGAVVPGVDVTLTRTDTGAAREAVTNETGAYAFPSLNPGAYRLQASLQGFRTFVQSDIVLQVEANLVIDPTLAVGELGETVEVRGTSQIQVELRAMAVSEVMEGERILELPLAARDATSLITLSGAAVDVGAGAIGGTMTTGTAVSVAGGQRMGVQYTLDGAMHNNRWFEGSMPTPFPDALAEFRISTSAQEAQTGRSSGATVSQVTRSGTNDFHSTVFWFGRNAALNARQTTARQRDPLKRNQSGGTVGGPVVRNRLFFFGGYQSTVDRAAPTSTLSIVPTAAILAGDWTAFNRCYRPTWRDPDLAAGRIDPARYSRVALNLAARLPQAENECGEIRWGTRSQRHDKQIVTRGDFQQSANVSYFGRYLGTQHSAPLTYDASNLLTAGASTLAESNWAHQFSVGQDWVLNANTVNSFRVAHSRIITDRFGARFFDPRDVGINAWTSVPEAFQFAVDGHFSFGSGMAYTNAWQKQYQVANHLTMIRGAHQLGVGVDWARDDIISFSNTFGVGNMTVGPDRTGNAMGDLMLGYMTQIRQSMPGLLSPVQHYVGVYAQDTWRATPRLTLNYGVRWEPFLPFRWVPSGETGGVRVYNFSVDDFKAGKKSVVFPTAPAGLSYPSQSADGSGPADFPGASGITRRLAQFAPRIGAALDPTGAGRTSIRGSYGISYELVQLNVTRVSNGTSPWSADLLHRLGTLANPWEGMTGGNPFPFDWRQTPLFLPASVALPFDPNLNTPYTHNWSLSVQQELAGRWRASASYLGNLGQRMWGTEALNPVLFLTQQSHPRLFTGSNTCVLEGQSFTPCNTAGNVNQRRDLRLWANANGTARQIDDMRFISNIDMWRSDRSSIYHGLLTSIRGEVGGVNLNANYTVSQCTSDRLILAIANPNQSPHNLDTLDRAPCSQDRRHIFNMTAIVSTPRFANRVLRAVAGDWQLSVIGRASSGAPQTIVAGTDRALTGLAGQAADQVLDDVFLDTSGALGSVRYNRAAFAVPALGTYGNAGLFSIPGISTWTLDAALMRQFRIGDSRRVELRLEAFNLPNAVRAVDPTANITSVNFGRITAVYDPRIVQFALKYVF
jgi:hypothetical protein